MKFGAKFLIHLPLRIDSRNRFVKECMNLMKCDNREMTWFKPVFLRSNSDIFFLEALSNSDIFFLEALSNSDICS